MTLIGRERELGVVEDVLASLSDRGAALLVRGEAGIGKSSILAEGSALAAGRGMLVLSATGVESESAIPFAGLHQIVRPILGAVAGLPAPQRRALAAAFGEVDTAAPDLFLIALATLNLVSEAADRAVGVVVVIDDGQWLDTATSQILAFVARRIASDRVAILISIREGDDSPLAAAGVPELVLEPLSADASGALLDALYPDLSIVVRDRILVQADGNPLGLVELPSALGSERSSDEARLPEQLALTLRLERAFATRLRGLPDATRALLLVAAIDDRGSLAELLRAATVIARDAVGVEALGAAIAARVVVADETAIHFRHPLVRSAVYQDAGVAGRASAHAALASVISDDPDRRAWHRAGAAVGPDDAIATELDESAARANRRGAIAAAAAILGRAAELTLDPRVKASRLVRAAELSFETGRRDVILRTLQQAESLNPDSLDQARIVWLRETVGSDVVFDEERVRSLVAVAKGARIDGDADLEWRILWLVAQRCWFADPGRDARELVINAARDAGYGQDDPRWLSVLAYAAPIDCGATVMDGLKRALAKELPDPASARLLGSAGLVVGAFDLGYPFQTAASEGLRAQGRLGHLARVLTVQARFAVQLGDWQVAVPAAEEALGLATANQDPIWIASAQTVLADLEGSRGHEERAEDLCLAAEQVASPLKAGFILAVIQVARGMSALTGGRPGRAFEHLRRVFDPSDSAFHHIVRTWAVGDLAEAASLCGQLEPARRIVAELETLAARTPSPWFGAGMRYGRALLAPTDRAEELFSEALAGDAQWPVHRARVLLSYGIWLRRHRRVTESRSPLRAARDSFDAIGVGPWADRARQELRASGERSGNRRPAAFEQLTPQELQVARMAADGLSNREIGAQLYLSHRTIAFHLHQVYGKLEITSRAQLHRVLDSGAGDTMAERAVDAQPATRVAP